MKRTLFALALAALSLPATAGAQTLYEGSLGTAPGDQGWLAVTLGATETVGGGTTTLDTTALNSLQAGYSRADTLLDRTTGFTLRFTVQLLAETHARNDRAGFSLLCLTSDARGIELGFWTDRVWAQADTPLFTHAEEALFATTRTLTGYELKVLGDTYQLRAGGAPLLSGALRDYRAFSGFPDPYETPNFLFLGDNTTSARGAFRLQQVAVSAPEPSPLALVAPSLMLLPLRRRRR